MNGMKKNKFYWILGTAVALVGVAAVRLVAPELNGMNHKVLVCLGYFVSLSGIVVVAYGAHGGRRN
jgi:hypothetical protein